MKDKRSPSDEFVLAFPVLILRDAGYFEGLTLDVNSYLSRILKSPSLKFVPRLTAEDDPSMKQLIPYVIFRHQDQVFNYRRGKLLGEKRLLGLRSIGVGGHIPVQDRNLFTTSYEQGLERELCEEVDFPAPVTKRVAGLLNDDSNEVGRVHFGVVHVFELAEPSVKPREKSINEPGFVDTQYLHDELDTFESWSQISIRSIADLLS